MTMHQNHHRALRLAILAPGEIFGGAERQLLTLCAWLMGNGVMPVVILFHDATFAGMLRRSGIEPFILSGKGAFSATAVTELRSHLRRASINVLHFHGYKAAVHAWLATIGQPVAMVKVEHGAIETRSQELRERSRTALYRCADTLATKRIRPAIVYVTHDLEQTFGGTHDGLERRVIHNGIDLPAGGQLHRPAEYENTKRNVLILGRLEEVKGIEYAIRALTETSMPANTVLHIVGDGPLRQSLEQIAAAHAVQNRVLFHGFRQNAYDYLAHADALLMPSMHEGLPYVLLEAMSLRVPAVVTAVGGLKEVLTNEVTGLLVAPSDARAIADALGRLFETPALREKLQNAAYELVTTRFSAAAMGSKYLALYQGAVVGAAR